MVDDDRWGRTETARGVGRWRNQPQRTVMDIVSGQGRRSRVCPWRWGARGLTLVELLVAMAIMVTVIASTMLIFRGVTRAWRSGTLRASRYQQARLLVDVFTRELSSCVLDSRYPFMGIDQGDAGLKTGSQGDEVFFVGALPGRAGLVERGYWMNGSGELMCHDDEPADGDYVGTGLDEICGTDVTAFDVSYYDGSDWVTAWDAQSGAAQEAQVPKAVRIVLTIGEQAEEFELIIDIPTS